VSVRLALVLALLLGIVISYLTSINPGRVPLVLGPDWRFDVPVMALAVAAFLLGAAVALLLGLVRDLNRSYRGYLGMRRARRDAGLSEVYHRGVDAQLAGRVLEAAEAYAEVVRREPGHGEAHSRLGELEMERGDAKAALNHHLQALRADERPETLLAAAQAYRRAGRPEDAAALYDAVLKQDRNHVTALRGLRDVGSETGRWADALRAQERLLALASPADRGSESGWLAGIHYEIGRARLGAGDASGAVAAFREALRAEPDFLPALVALGDGHLKAGDRKAAIRAWERALEAQPAVPLLSRLDQAYRGEGRPTRMIALHQQAAARQPDNTSLAFSLGRVYFDLSMLDEAADQLQKVEVRAPDLAVVHAYLGAVFERRGQAREAFEEYRRALRLAGSFDWPHRCTACGARHAGWVDRCPACHRWNTSRP
jgi:lipopolysaccharide biosynthesis regulator YciM